MSEDFKQDLLRCGVDLNGALARFAGMEPLYQKFLFKFLDDGCYNDLIAAVSSGDVEAAFVASHTLKGVAANLGLNGILEPLSHVVEKCRNGEMDSQVEEYMEKVRDRYLEIRQVLQQERDKS